METLRDIVGLFFEPPVIVFTMAILSLLASAFLFPAGVLRERRWVPWILGLGVLSGPLFGAWHWPVLWLIHAVPVAVMFLFVWRQGSRLHPTIARVALFGPFVLLAYNLWFFADGASFDRLAWGYGMMLTVVESGAVAWSAAALLAARAAYPFTQRSDAEDPLPKAVVASIRKA
jgi:hypothetical protein